MVATFEDDFSVAWQDSQDAGYHWAIATNRPVAPLTQALDSVIMAAIFASRSVYVNGYAFRTGSSWTLPRVPAELEERSKSPQVWQDYYLPAASEIAKRIRGRDYGAMSSEETATAVEVAFNEAAIGFRYAMLLRHLAEHDLTEFCQQELGDGPESLVATLLQGHPNPSTATGSTLEELAAFASTHPDLAEALGAGRHDRLDALPGGEEFTHRLNAFLEEYGWRVEAWELVHVPTWAEKPAAVLTLIARYLRDKDHLPSAAMSRAVEQRLAAMQELEGRLDQSKLGRFRQLLSACDGYVFMNESRYHAIVTLLGSVRVPALALGSKLSAVGVINEPDDIFFLTLTEAQKQAVASERPMQDVVAGRKADLERWQELVPPHFIGSAPRPGDMPPRAAFSSHQAEPVPGVLVVGGQGASRGTHRALARVILNLSDAHRLQPGEILVSRWTAAPWAPLFAIAGGVVTDSGGILDHAAICAREYGIPCVVATRDGTSRIPDGATVTIDGGKGTVVIEG